MNLAASSPNLVEDSPQYRADEQKNQLENMTRAADEAMRAVRQRTLASQAQTVGTQMDSLRQITPMPSPLSGPEDTFFPEMPPEMNSPMSPNVPGPAEFIAPSVIQDLAAAPQTSQQTVQQEDPAAEVGRISQATGIPPQTIAAMALLGQDIAQIEQTRGGPPPVAPSSAPVATSVAPGPPSPAPLMETPPPQGPQNIPNPSPAPLLAPIQ